MNGSLCRVHGFSLVELIAVLLIVGILSVAAFSRIIPADSAQLQSSRDMIVAAFYSAQQLAMTRQHQVQLITGISSIDIRMDSNNDSNFTADESVTVGGVAYPISFPPSQTLTAANFNYNRLGYTSGGTLQLRQNGQLVAIDVDDSGFTR